MGAALFDYQRLMAGAADPDDIATLAFGGVLARFRLMGLDAATQNRLLHRYFPGADPATAMVAGAGAGCTALPADEFDDLRTLLMAHRSDAGEEGEWLACIVATACLGNNHLWQDMGLPSRDALSQLLQRHFTALFARNSGNMKWKKFFYKQLCERTGVNLCKAPSCSVCSDYARCFGSEDGPSLVAVSVAPATADLSANCRPG